MPKILSCIIHCYTHELNADAFRILAQDGINIKVSAMEKDHFVLEVSDVLGSLADDQIFANTAHTCLNLYLVALNVCTLGLFLNHGGRNISPEYQFLDAKNIRNECGILVHNINATDLAGRVISSEEIKESLCLYGALAREKNGELVSEYLRGLIHLSLNYPGVHFEKDAFSNFYRTFEHLVTSRVLKQTKLKNERKDLSRALSLLGFSSVITDEFKELYSIRGEQAMHAQRAPEKITRENTMKMKVFTDVVIQKVYKPIWEAGINSKQV
jgi:hypothetical protein